MTSDPWAQQAPSNGPFGGQQQAPTWGGQPQQGGQQPGQQQPPSLGDALGGAGAQSAFDKDTPVGVIIRGAIMDTTVQQTRFDPRFWDDGNPKWIIVIRIQSAEWSQDGQNYQPLRTSQEDTGVRAFYIKTWGDNFRALQEAIQTTGHTEAEKALVPGTLFTGKHTGRQRSPKGGNDELLYAYLIGGESAQPVQQPTQQQGPWQPSGTPQEEPPF